MKKTARVSFAPRVAARWHAVIASACFAFAPISAHSADIRGALKTYDAQMFDYFRNLKPPLLPIFTPAGEEPGDAYRDAYGGGYAARRPDCFASLRATESPSNLAEVFDARTDVLSGNVKADLTAAADVLVDGAGRWTDKTEIRFADVSVKVVSDAQLTKALKRNALECKGVIDAVTGVPSIDGVLILGQVFVAKKVMSIGLLTAASAGASAAGSTDKLLKKLGAGSELLKRKGLVLELKGEVSGSHSHEQRVTLIESRSLPIAFRPAFISQSHFGTIMELRNKGTLQFVEATIQKNRSTAVAKDFPNSFVSPQKLWAAVRSGAQIPFDPNNPDHVDYLRWLGMLFAVGYDLFGR